MSDEKSDAQNTSLVKPPAGKRRVSDEELERMRKRRPLIRGGNAKLNIERIERLEEAYKLGLTLPLAAKYAGISEASLSLWLKKGRENPESPYGEVVRRVEGAEAEGAMLAMKRIRAAGKKQWQAAAWLMERRHGYTTTQRWEGKLEVDVQHWAELALSAGEQPEMIEAEVVEAEVLELPAGGEALPPSPASPPSISRDSEPVNSPAQENDVGNSE